MASDTVSLFVDPTGVGDMPSTPTALYPNMPNPFNPTTTVRYSLATRQRVQIAVYDVSGALVRTLVDEVRPAGAQSATWHGTDGYGQRVASGVYFIRMVTAGFVQSHKAILLK